MGKKKGKKGTSQEAESDEPVQHEEEIPGPVPGHGANASHENQEEGPLIVVPEGEGQEENEEKKKKKNPVKNGELVAETHEIHDDEKGNTTVESHLKHASNSKDATIIVQGEEPEDDAEEKKVDEDKKGEEEQKFNNDEEERHNKSHDNNNNSNNNYNKDSSNNESDPVSPNSVHIPRVISEENVSFLASSFSALFAPTLQRMQSQLDEVTDSQRALLSIVSNETTVLFENPALADVIETMSKLPRYNSRLASIRKEMLHLHERSSKLIKRVEAVKGKIEKEQMADAAARDKQQEKERRLLARPSKELQDLVPPPSSASAQPLQEGQKKA